MLSLFFTLFCLAMQAQFSNPYLIPSFNVPVDSGYARFQENIHVITADSPLGKRDAHVTITSRGPEISECLAQVWLYSLDGLNILGPYTVLCGEILIVEIDERDWGVLVQTDYDVWVDVWIE